MSRITLQLACWSATFLGAAAFAVDTVEFEGWRPFRHRNETAPGFEIRRDGGPHGHGGLVIRHDDREHLDGAWMKTLEVRGGSHYRITAYARMTDVVNPRAHTYVELLFHDDKNRLVDDKQIGVKSRPFYPAVVKSDVPDWTKFSGIYRGPAAATHATIRLHLRWEPGGQIEWGDIDLQHQRRLDAERRVGPRRRDARPRNRKGQRRRRGS